MPSAEVRVITARDAAARTIFLKHIVNESLEGFIVLLIEAGQITVDKRARPVRGEKQVYRLHDDYLSRLVSGTLTWMLDRT